MDGLDFHEFINLVSYDELHQTEIGMSPQQVTELGQPVFQHENVVVEIVGSDVRSHFKHGSCNFLREGLRQLQVGITHPGLVLVLENKSLELLHLVDRCVKLGLVREVGLPKVGNAAVSAEIHFLFWYLI